jgi:hypothetical protein
MPREASYLIALHRVGAAGNRASAEAAKNLQRDVDALLGRSQNLA